MSFLDYLKDHRGQFLDHRAAAPTNPGPSAAEAEEARLDDPHGSGPPGASRGGRSTAVRRRRPREQRNGIRYRHIRPAFSPSPYSDPLPYEAPWERAFR